jgi:hypothetical protein
VADGAAPRPRHEKGDFRRLLVMGTLGALFFTASFAFALRMLRYFRGHGGHRRCWPASCCR